MLKQLTALLVVVALTSSVSLAFGDDGDDNVMRVKSPKGASFGPELHTNIALVGAEGPVSTYQQEQPNVLVDPSKLFDKVSEEYRNTDIEEDPEDRFVTTRSGKPRVQLVDEVENWADESPLGSHQGADVKALIRKKRCGGGDDGGGAQRARRARRARRTQRSRVRRERRAQRKAARKAARTRTTTITRTILPANQVNTHLQQQQGAVAAATTTQQIVTQPAGQVTYVQQQPGVVHQQTVAAPTVQHFETVQQAPQVQVMSAAATAMPQVQYQTAAGVTLG